MSVVVERAAALRVNEELDLVFAVGFILLLTQQR